MTFLKSALAGAAIAGLLASQPAAAASAARLGSDVEGENLAGMPAGAGPVVAVLAVFFLAAAVALITDDDDDSEPVSP